MNIELPIDQKIFFDQQFDSLKTAKLNIDAREFHGCHFRNSQLTAANLIRSKFFDCSFINCDFSNAIIKDTIWRHCEFVDSKFLGLNWTIASALTHPAWRRCILSLGNFSGMDLRHARLEECTAREVEFAHANLSDAFCQNTDFKGSRFHQTNLTKTDMRNAINYVIHPQENILKKTHFSLPEAISLLYGLDILLSD